MEAHRVTRHNPLYPIRAVSTWDTVGMHVCALARVIAHSISSCGEGRREGGGREEGEERGRGEAHKQVKHYTSASA